MLLLGFLLSGPGTAIAQEHQIILRVEETNLRAVCDTLVSTFGVPLAYRDADVRDVTVSVNCDACSVDELLDGALEGTPLTWRRINRQYIISHRPVMEPKPEGTIWGTITDSATGEPVADAAVYLYYMSETATGDGGGPALRESIAGNPTPAPLRAMQANSSGFFSLRNVPAGNYRLVVRMIGYDEKSTPCAVESGASKKIPVELSSREIRMKEMVIRAWRSAFSVSEAVSHGVYVPATPSDHNQYFLDGERIFNPSHYGGLVSTFNEEAFNDLDVRSGGMPPYYGGRIGGIVDLSLRDGSSAGVSGLASVGTLGSSLSIGGPVAGPVTFMLSGRQDYPSVTGPPDPADGPLANARATEVISKVTLRTSSTGRLFLTGYYGRDNYHNAPRADWASLTNDLTWRNASIGLRWAGVVPPALFLQIAAGFTGYDFSSFHYLRDYLVFGEPGEYSSDYRIGDFTFRADAEHYYDSWHTVQGGVEVIHHGMSGSLSPFTTEGAVLPWSAYTAWELSVYMQDQWRLHPRVLAELGARATSFLGEEGSHSTVDPRFSVFISASEGLGLRAALVSVTEFLHPYRNSGLFLFYPPVFWYPSSDRVDPSTAIQLSVGADHRPGAGDFSIEIDAYYRLTRNAHEFVYERNGFITTTLDDAVINGDEKAWGVRLMLRQRGDRLRGYIGYNLTWVTQQFDALNGGNSFVPRFHRRHEVVTEVEYLPGAGWTAGILAVIASDQSPSYNQVGEDAVHAGVLDPFDLNGNRLPGFERVEVRIGRVFPVPRAGTMVSLRLLSSYGIIDPYDWELKFSPDIRQIWRATLRDADLVPRYPVLTVSMKL